MTFKRLLVPMLLVGIICVMGSVTVAQAATSINCGLSTPLGTTTRATATGHTEPIGAGGATLVAAGPPIHKAAPGTATGGPLPVPIIGGDGGGVLRITCINNTGATIGTALDPGVVVLTLNFGVPITNTTTTHPTGTTMIRLANGTGDFCTAVIAPCAANNVAINTTNYSAGTIVIGLGTPATLGGTPNTGITFTAGPFTSTFDVLGVLVSTNGKTGSVVANLTSTGGITVGPAPAGAGTAAGPATLPVIGDGLTNAILPGLQDPTVPSSLPSLAFFNAPIAGGSAVLNSSGGAIKGNFVLRIQENYIDMLKEATQFNGPGLAGVFPNSPSSDTQVQIVLNNIPSGLDISNCAATMTNGGGTAVTAGLPSINFTNITSASPILTVNFNEPLDQDNIDVLWVKCATVAVGTATLPLPSTPVTAQVQLGPTGSALSGTGGALTALTTGQIPRYQASLQPTTAITVVVFPPSNTTMLLTFGFVGPGYNTGLAVSNTTTDPFGPTGGGAALIDGTVTFLMVKNDGTTKTYTTTTGSPGGGLTGAGIVKTGSTYVVNLSELLTAANFGTTFTGYVFITANFTHGHGAATIYTTATGAAALSSPVLVLPGVSTAVTRGSPESLGQ